MAPASPRASRASPIASNGRSATWLPSAARVSAIALLGIDEQLDRPVARHRGVAQRQRRVGHVAAADVEQPGDRFRLVQDRDADVAAVQGLGDQRALGGAVEAGQVGREHLDPPERRRRPALPDAVDRVGVEGDQGAAGTAHRVADPAHPGHRVQLRIIPEPAAGQVLGDVVGRRGAHQVADLPAGAVDLLAGLQGVATVDEQRRPVGEHHGDAGRAGESGQPGQPFGAERQMLAHVLVGARQHEAVDMRRRQGGAQPVQPVAVRPGRGRSQGVAQRGQCGRQRGVGARRDQRDPGVLGIGGRRGGDPRQARPQVGRRPVDPGGGDQTGEAAVIGWNRGARG